MQSYNEIRGFHAHIYYDATSLLAASHIRNTINHRFHVKMGRWRDKPVGPHPQSMFQVAFDTDTFALLVPWLMLNHAELSVLIHPRTDDEVTDHTNAALWLGNRLDLNVEFLLALDK